MTALQWKRTQYVRTYGQRDYDRRVQTQDGNYMSLENTREKEERERQSRPNLLKYTLNLLFIGSQNINVVRGFRFPRAHKFIEPSLYTYVSLNDGYN